jgi:hypothetical protein
MSLDDLEQDYCDGDCQNCLWFDDCEVSYIMGDDIDD